MIINFISGPRNISTAMMYSFAQRPDTKVMDEPFYAHYLTHTGFEHPGREQILQSMESDPEKVISHIHDQSTKFPVVFLKNMAHHHTGMSWDYLKDMKIVFLIRDPKQLIASFAQVIEKPDLLDIGLKVESELLQFVHDHGSHPPVVIDTNQMLENPEAGLKSLCHQLDLPFRQEMLGWDKGALPEDGVWAPYWYKNVHNSTGFQKQKTSERPLPDHCQDLLAEARPYYDHLASFMRRD